MTNINCFTISYCHGARIALAFYHSPSYIQYSKLKKTHIYLHKGFDQLNKTDRSIINVS